MSIKSNYRDGDFFSKKSKKEGYRSRASYKLKEILKTDINIKKGQSVFDLGSYPGSWSQVAIELVGSTGKVAAIDIQEMKLQNCFFLHKSIEEIHEIDFQEISEFVPFDLVLSDMAPNISGVRAVDQARAMDLADIALHACESWLGKGGDLALKAFQGEGLDIWVAGLRQHFERVNMMKPKASRPESREVFVVARGFVTTDG